MRTETLKTHDGLTLTYHVSGSGDDVLFIANVPGLNLRFWFPLMDILAKRYRVIGFEYRGFPDNTRLLSEEELSFESILQDVDAIMDAEEVQQVHWMSWCAGGSLANTWTERNPGRTRSFIKLSTPFGKPPKNATPPTAEFYGVLRQVSKLVKRQPDIAERICLMLRELGDVPSVDFFEKLQPDDPALAPVMKMVDLLEAESSHSNLTFHQIDEPTGLRNYFNLTLAFEAAHPQTNWFRYPTLLLNGRQDGFIGRPFMGDLFWPMPIEMKIIDDASHFLVMERPETVAGHIEHWLDHGQYEVSPHRPHRDQPFETIDDDNFDSWSAEVIYQIDEMTRAWLKEVPLSPRMRVLVDRVTERYLCPGVLSFGRDAVLVYYGITGTWKPALPVGVLSAMIWSGAHCFDDLCDGDLPSEWDYERRQADATVASATYSTILPPLYLNTLNLPRAQHGRLLKVMSEGVLQLLSGQLEDIHGTGDPSQRLEDVVASVLQREPWGIFMEMAAILAGASEEVAKDYKKFGDYYGLRNSLRKDVWEMHQDPERRDLKNGTFTLYLAACAEVMDPEDRKAFEQAFLQAPESEASREAVIRQLRNTKFFNQINKATKAFAEQAVQGLDAAAPTPEFRGLLLKRMIKSEEDQLA